MSKPTTHVLLITDMSGSMAPLADEVIGGCNSYLDKLVTDGGKYRITLTLFDTEFIPLCVAAKVKDAPRLTPENYAPRGMTALLDAVGKTIAEFDSRTKLADGDRVIVVVQTDGHENSSQEFTSEQIAALIREREATGRWMFVYLGAGANAWGQGQKLGMRSVDVAADAAGTQASYAGLATASGLYSRGASRSVTFDALASEAGDPGSAA